MERLFQAFSDRLGLPLDQVRYLVLLLSSQPIAFFFYHVLSPSRVSVSTRHVFSTAVGIWMGCACFGWQMLFLFGMVGISYALLWLMPPTSVHRYSLVWAMGCTCTAHLYRLLTDYGGYTLDFSGPMMLLVQKVTYVAFALHDGLARKESELSADQKEEKIIVRPPPLEYLSYMFNFHSLLAGPTCTFSDHLGFMDGSYYRQSHDSDSPKLSYPLFAVGSKAIYSLMCLAVYMGIGQYYSGDEVLDPAYMSSPISIVFTWTIVGAMLRFRYYFIWLLTEGINNAAGLGFSGYDKFGNPEWNLMTNIRVWDVELPSNIRSSISAFNCTTQVWLRRVCFDRVKFYPGMMTFLLSAFWHGFYPNYYLTLIYVGFEAEAARKIRKLVRPYFLKSPALKLFYDIITVLTTKFFTEYGLLPIIFLWPDKALVIWGYYYYLPVVIIFVIAVFFPSGKKRKEKTGSSEVTPPKNRQQVKDIKTD